MYAAIFAMGAAVIIIALLLVVAFYVLLGYAYYKALKMKGYDKAWMGWIPYAQNYALADAIGSDDVDLIGSLKVPMNIFKFWWIIPLVLLFFSGAIVQLLSIAVNVICAGWIFKKYYAEMDGKDERDVAVLAYISGWLQIIAMVKFLCIKNK